MITAIGDTTLDLISSTLKSLPEEDTEKNIKFTAKIGGQAAHTALGLARLGIKTKFISSVGKDNFGDSIIDRLKKETNLQLKLQRKGATGLSVIIPTPCRRTIFNDDGANALFSQVDFKELSGKYLFIGGFWHLKKLNIINLLKAAKSRGMTTFLDLGYSEKPLRKKLFEALRYVDYCFLDRKELFQITKETNLLKALRKVPAIVVLHLAEKGSGIFRNGQLLITPAKRVYSLETTGAGDFWNAGFIKGIMHKWPVKRVLRYANYYAIDCLRKEIHHF